MICQLWGKIAFRSVKRKAWRRDWQTRDWQTPQSVSAGKHHSDVFLYKFAAVNGSWVSSTRHLIEFEYRIHEVDAEKGGNHIGLNNKSHFFEACIVDFSLFLTTLFLEALIILYTLTQPVCIWGNYGITNKHLGKYYNVGRSTSTVRSIPHYKNYQVHLHLQTRMEYVLASRLLLIIKYLLRAKGTCYSCIFRGFWNSFLYFNPKKSLMNIIVQIEKLLFTTLIASS